MQVSKIIMYKKELQYLLPNNNLKYLCQKSLKDIMSKMKLIHFIQTGSSATLIVSIRVFSIGKA